jgi:outer membrane protein assembly factor BamB
MLQATAVSLLLITSLAPAADLNEDLLAAARKGDVEAVKSLVAKGADVNAKSAYGATALHFAADRGHVAVIKLLLELKADPNVRDTFYQASPMNWALLGKHGGVVKALIEGGATGAEDALQGAAVMGYEEVVRAVLETGKLKEAALTKALAVTPAQHTAVVELLTKAGAKSAPKKPVSAEAPKETEPRVVKEEDRGGAVKAALNWPSFRGPNASGVADGQFPPVTWDAGSGRNVRWKTPIPGLGHSCPVVWGDRVYVTTAVSADGKAEFRPGLYGDVHSVEESAEQSWRVYCVEARTGKVLWERTACKGVPKVKRHPKASHANSTPATDGTHVVASFGSEGLYCYDRDGKLLWEKNLGVLNSAWFYNADYQWGFGSSPILYNDLVIVQCDVGKGSFLAAFRIADGSEAWRQSRDEIPSWGTPTIVEGPQRVELVTNATRYARGYDPMTGKELWRLGRHAEITVPAPVFGEGLIFVSSGYRPVQPIYAIRPGADGDVSLKEGSTSSDAVAWSTEKGGPYMPTPIVYDGHLYVCSNNGFVTCYEAKTGKQVYRQRLGGAGGYTASPVAADGKLYFTSEESGVRVVQAGPKFKLLAVNEMGDACMATPAISDGMIFLRSQHYLFGIGRAAKGESEEKEKESESE